MEVSYVPDFFIAKGKVNPEEQIKLTEYLKNDVGKFIGKTTESSYKCGHNLFITSPTHSDSEDNIDYSKYDKILRKYILDFIKEISNKNFEVDLSYYVNIYSKNQYASPHYDGKDFTMIYYGKSDKNNSPTSLAISERWIKLCKKYEKLPILNDTSFDFYGDSGNILFFPSNILHWVKPNISDEERIVLVCGIMLNES